MESSISGGRSGCGIAISVETAARSPVFFDNHSANEPQTRWSPSEPRSALHVYAGAVEATLTLTMRNCKDHGKRARSRSSQSEAERGEVGLSIGTNQYHNSCLTFDRVGSEVSVQALQDSWFPPPCGSTATAESHDRPVLDDLLVASVHNSYKPRTGNLARSIIPLFIDSGNRRVTKSPASSPARLMIFVRTERDSQN